MKSGSLKTKTCPKHGEYKVKGFELGERWFEQACPECREERLIEQKAEERERQKKEKIERLLSQTNVPHRFKNCTMEGYVTGNHQGKIHAQKVVQNFVDKFEICKQKGTSLVFCGKPGTGKTHLACSIVLDLAKKGFSTLYTVEYRLLRAIKETWNKGAMHDENIVMKKFISPALLIIDEVGVTFGTESERVLLYQIINGRYEQSLPMIIIGNLTESELKDHIGERAFDRLQEAEGCTVAFDWESYRVVGK